MENGRKPLIKWPGGKSAELRHFLYLIPDYDRYIEPFVGGGALYFYCRPPKAVINDTSEYLMDFYALVQEQDPEFRRILDLYCRNFSALKEKCDRHYERIRGLYRLYEMGMAEGIDVAGLHLCRPLTEELVSDAQILGDLVPDPQDYLQQMNAAVEDKLIRTVRNQRKSPFSEKDLKANLITGFTSGFYLYFRGVFNEIAAGRMLCSKQYRVANFYFVREYCYGSMFRYNSRGEFNIPYGGISYNKKDLKDKIEAMYDPSVAALLERTQLYCMDFEQLLGTLDLNERDFLFLDPPYDTEFSEYEGKDFDKNDQKRLADFLKTTKAQFLLVIKNTPYISQLYEGHFRILTFENQYGYNVRSRNDRKAEHLIVTNIPEDALPLWREFTEEDT